MLTAKRSCSVVAICFLAACASSRPPLVAPSSLEVDPMVDFVEIPLKACPGYSFDFALSERGLRRLLTNDIRAQHEHALALATCQTRTEIAEAQAAFAIDAAKTADWWSRNGLLIGVIGGFITGGVVGVVVGGVVTRVR